ncbi:MAG: preprotein translocase subunit SecE [Bacteroidota bacterium]
MSKIKTFILGSIDEIRNKVTWPAYRELQSSSILVLTASLVFALAIGAIDLVYKNVIAWFYSTF